MKNMLMLGTSMMVLVWASPAFADKVDDVKKAIAEAPGCNNKTVSNSDALRYVKDLFLKCTPGQEVEVDGCKVMCLKK